MQRMTATFFNPPVEDREDDHAFTINQRPLPNNLSVQTGGGKVKVNPNFNIQNLLFDLDDR